MDFVEIKLTLTSSVVPSVYAGEIKCHILRDKRDYDEEELSKKLPFSNFKIHRSWKKIRWRFKNI